MKKIEKIENSENENSGPDALVIVILISILVIIILISICVVILEEKDENKKKNKIHSLNESQVHMNPEDPKPEENVNDNTQIPSSGNIQNNRNQVSIFQFSDSRS